MAQMPKGQARSVEDPDAEAYDAMIRKEKERRERARKRAENLQETAGLADKIVTTAQELQKGFAETLGSFDEKKAAMAAGRIAGRASHILSGISSIAGFNADLGKGMASDEAAIKHGGGFALGAAGSALGAVKGAAFGGLAGPPGAVAGGVGGALGGGMAGEKAAEIAAVGWGRVKRAAPGARETMMRTARKLNDPWFWYARPLR